MSLTTETGRNWFINWYGLQEGHSHDITDKQLEQLDRFKENLLDWNNRMNLTAITDDEGVWQKHFSDSLTLLPFLPPQSGSPLRMIDVGCGAGFPGLPVKIMRQDIFMTMLDSLRKRIFFLEDTISRLNLKDIECIHDRAEDLAKKSEYFRQYDICTSRAVARLDKLCGWCLPFVKDNGLFLAMKGPDVAAELEEAMPVICKMGAEVAEVRLIEILPGMAHSIVAIKKCG